MNAQELIQRLGLQPLQVEGGYFAETYRSEDTIPPGAIHRRYAGGRAVSTAIYYLLTPETVSRIHRLRSDEIFHFYAGDAVEMLQLLPDGSHKLILIGNDIAGGQLPQVIVPREVWQGARLAEGGRWALMGTTVAPGFDYGDYDNGDPGELIRLYPDCAEMIAALAGSCGGRH